MRYHHGNARAALIAAAEAWLEEVGPASLSLRGIAERAGLSRQAPYNHFADKKALLAAVVANGFHRLEAEMRVAAERRTGADALAGVGGAYISFALARPALFRLMFARELVDPADYPASAAAGAAAYEVLSATISPLCPPRRVTNAALAAWSIVHGYATLCNERGIEGQEQAGARAAQFADLVIAGFGHAEE